MNTQEVLDPKSWAERTFGGVQLHDLRRTKRAVQAATKLAENPLGSLPAQMQTWRETKALYRLLRSSQMCPLRPGCSLTCTRPGTKPMLRPWCSWCKIPPILICPIVDIHQRRGTNRQRTRTGFFRANGAGGASRDARGPRVHGSGTRMSRIRGSRGRTALSTAQAGRARKRCLDAPGADHWDA
jgi:Transposase DNA-binding